MSLRTVHGRPIGVSLQEGVIEDSRGSNLTEFIEMSNRGGVEERVWAEKAPFACQVERSTFGMPTWLFWTLVATVVVAIIAIVVTSVVSNRHYGERRRRR